MNNKKKDISFKSKIIMFEIGAIILVSLLLVSNNIGIDNSPKIIDKGLKVGKVNVEVDNIDNWKLNEYSIENSKEDNKIVGVFEGPNVKIPNEFINNEKIKIIYDKEVTQENIDDKIEKLYQVYKTDSNGVGKINEIISVKKVSFDDTKGVEVIMKLNTRDTHEYILTQRSFILYTKDGHKIEIIAHGDSQETVSEMIKSIQIK